MTNSLTYEFSTEPSNLFDTSYSPTIAARAETSLTLAPAKRFSAPAHGLGEEAIEIVLSLSMDLGEVSDRGKFQKEVHADVVWATGVDASKIVVQRLREGSVLVDVAIARDIAHVVHDLQQQV